MAAVLLFAGFSTAAARAASPAAGPPLAPCTDWPVTLGYGQLNAGGPDTEANYWVLSYAGTAGERLQIHGAYPAARFFSFAVQDTSQTTLGSMRDSRLAPDAGSRNPFTDPTADPTVGANTYTAYIDFAPPPGDPSGAASNTFYAGQTLDGQPNFAGTLIYRVYVPTDQSDPRGGVALPTVSLEAGATSVPLSFRPCSAIPPNTGGPANSVVNSVSHPDAVPNPKSSNKAYLDPNFVRVFAGQLYEPVTNSLPASAASLVPARKGIPLENADFPYLMSSISRYYGQVVALKLLAPTFPDTVHGQSVLGDYQTRYWSVCTFSDATEGGIRTYGCLTDFLASPSSDGYLRVVVSDPAHRPAHLAPDVRWLDWGPNGEDYVFYRVGVPNPAWPSDPDYIDPSNPNQAQAAATTMGAYYPLARYCPTLDPSSDAGFDACFAS